ncbi:UDP-glucose/GDP-mannose dehydrogenase family protein, partial [bacterium]|nr:UDP-glucose/GDP-mannose dehydrogenase family protein [bacterium]
ADGTPVLSTTLESAEMVKYASNAFLATKVSFINEVAELCEKVGADVQVVARGMGMDTRIGAKFLHAGTGFGGSCFPKDTIALVKMGDSYGVDMSLVKSTIGANERQSSRAVGKLRRLCGGELSGLRIAVLGLSFKPNTDDVREASSLKIIQQLWDEGAEVVAYDPVAGDNAQRAMPNLELASCVDDCVTGADGLILATEWSEFRLLDMKKIASQLAHPRVVDCRNIYRPEQMEELGIAYDSFGRKAVDA